jgi:Disulphide bond corrector protein DsbC
LLPLTSVSPARKISQMPLKSYWKILPCLLTATLFAQMAPTLTIAPVPTVKAHKGSVAVVAFKAVLPPGYHANSNTPTDAYLIPLTLKWTGGPMQADGITYPKAAQEKYSFSEKPLSVVTGEFSISTKFKVPADAPTGAAAQNGTLKYQACNDRMCFAPKTVPISLSLDIE